MYLDKVFATTKVVEGNTHYRHLTMRGPGFMGNHPYFDDIIDTLRDLLDWSGEAIGRTGDLPPRNLTDCVEASVVPEIKTHSVMRQMLIDESRDLKSLVKMVYQGISDGEFNPSMESALTDFTDKLEQHAWWCDQTSETWEKR